MNLSVNRYFPGGNTTKGFFSYYDMLQNKNDLTDIYTIKGGPGVGKSTLMKKIGTIFEKDGCEVNYYHCSSDPYSLDGVHIPKKKILFVDGTSPHITDPKYPGAKHHLINLADFLNTETLKKNSDKIIEITDKISGLFSTAYCYLKATRPIYENLNKNYSNAFMGNQFNYLISYLDEIITGGKTGNGYSEKKMFLSAITPYGFKNFLNETVKNKNVYILNSLTGDLTHKVTNNIKTRLELKNFKTESYYCPIDPDYKLEHLIIPELDTAIITSNKFHIFKNGEIINVSQIYNASLLNKEAIEYDEKIIDNLLNKSVNVISLAKSTHDILEEYYISAMDYLKLDSFFNKIIKSITT